MQIIGVDCSAPARQTGLALAIIEGGGLRLRCTWVGLGRFARPVVEGWLTSSGAATLIAIDAPLGWPGPLSMALESHSAGSAIGTPADDMFRRATDRFVKHKIGKTPLDVGADRIARTAHAAVNLLGELRTSLGAEIPLAWDPADAVDWAAIEVYPAATLKAHGFPWKGYKERDRVRERGEIVDALRKRMTISQEPGW